MKNHSKKTALIRASINSKNEVICLNEFFFVKPKELELPKQDYRVNVEKVENNYIFKIESKTFLYRFYILCLNDTGVFSDNYFNMLPGENNTIVFSPSNEYKNNQNFNLDFEYNSVQGLSY